MPSRLVRWCLLSAGTRRRPLAAQQESITDKISDLFRFGTCGQPLCLDGSINAQNGHGDHFIPSAVAGNLQVINFLTDAVASTDSNFPIGSTSGGATYRLVGGVPVKTSNSLGPIFAERADNLGRGRFLMGAAVNFISYQSMRGVPINNLYFNFTHQDVASRRAWAIPCRENDIIVVQVALSVNQVVTAYYMTYGLLSRLDLSVAVPVVHASMEGSSTAQIMPFGTPAVHFFSGDSANPVLRAAATHLRLRHRTGRHRRTVQAGDHRGGKILLVPAGGCTLPDRRRRQPARLRHLLRPGAGDLLVPLRQLQSARQRGIPLPRGRPQ